MIDLPLYRSTASRVELTPRTSTSKGHDQCRRCSRWSHATTVCIEPEIIRQGDGPTLLLMGERPGRYEDTSGRPFFGRAGDLLRKITDEWVGSVVLDYAIRCYTDERPKKAQIGESLSQCRGYSLDTIRLAEPDRIIALGSYAAQSILGRVSYPYSVRRSYSWLSDGTPVFLGINPSAALQNRFVKQWFESDLRWSMSCKLPVPTQWDAEFAIVRTVEDSHLAVESLRRAKWFGFDIENSGVFGDRYFRVLALAACPGGSDYPYVWDEEALNNPEISAPLFEVLQDPKVFKTGHNVKHDMLGVRFGFGFEVQGIWADSMLDRRVIQADALAGLAVASEIVGMGGLKKEAELALAGAVATISAARKNHKATLQSGAELLSLPGFEEPAIEAACRLVDVAPRAFAYALLPYDILVRYVALDAVATTRLTEVQRLGFLGANKSSRVEECDRELVTLRWDKRGIRVARQFMTEAVRAYERIEAWGVGANVEAMREFNDFLHAARATELVTLKGLGLTDPSKNTQVERVLYDDLGVTCRAEFLTDTGKRGTNRKVLDELLKNGSPYVVDLINHLIEYRRLDKLLGTYAQGYIVHVREDGRIHANFKIAGTEAGRPSCENPNLQVLPRPNTVEGRMCRSCFVAAPGNLLIEGDYSQIEIREAAMLSCEPRMIEAFLNDEDLHWRTTKIIARAAWGLDPELMDPDKHEKQRTESKVTTFGLMYGKTVRTLARDLGISVEAAQVVVDSILGGYPRFAEWCDEQIQAARRYGEVFTYWDGDPLRRRPLWHIGDSQSDDRPTRRSITARNAAINTPIQGSASDYCLRSCIEIVDACVRGEIAAKVILTVHDSIVLEAREDRVEETVRKVYGIMMNKPTTGGVPLKVDFKVGRTFGDFEKYRIAA